MKFASLLLFVSAALHVAGYVLGGFTWMFLLLPPVIYVILIAGLSRGMMLSAWLAFFCMLIGAAGALAETFQPSAVPAWLFWSIFATDLTAAFALFGAIWSGRRYEESG